MKDKTKDHGPVDKPPSSELQFCNRHQLPLLCENSGTLAPVLTSLMAGRFNMFDKDTVLSVLIYQRSHASKKQSMLYNYSVISLRNIKSVVITLRNI